MLKLGIIEVGESDYMSPMILVEVAGEEPRPCLDYRKLNEIIRTEYFPLPNIEERVEKVSAAKFITVLDLSKGYWHIPLSKTAQRYAAFCTSFGTYRPLRMSFGLKNAPYFFSKLMAELLNGLEDFVVPYLDDIAIFSDTWESHIKHMGSVLQRIKRAKLTIKPSKCKFAQQNVKFLGHIVGQGFRTPSEIKVQAVLEFPTPRTKIQIRAFLGLAGYYQKYINLFSVIASPLMDALKGRTKKGEITWMTECENAFRELKGKLIDKPVLYAPNFEREFIVQTDASNAGMGAVLTQLTEQGEEHPILYLSKKFSEVEKRYCTTEKECASIVFAIKRHWFPRKVIATELIILKNAKGNRTLLGIDFLTAAGIVLDLQRKQWYFTETSHRKYNFVKAPPNINALLTVDTEPHPCQLRKKEGTHLSLTQRKEINSLLEKYEECFQPGGEPTPIIEHRINTRDHLPVAVLPYRMNPSKKEILKREIDKLLAEVIIEECESPYASPVVLIPKPKGTFRLCIDYRKLNEITVADTYSLPGMDDLLHQARLTPFMSTLNLRALYHQVKVHVEDQHTTAFSLLTPAERNYSTTEREALAVIWALKKFRGNIEGTVIIVASDHQPLKWLLNLKSPTG
ncbi:retrovirus-related Pol polyprotein from transposon 17.6 [Trichonephila clavipes]|uniref:RNA-directed DNA polymerase n=1 Tax=Trichonephila clavipes TaxID=2585209 RepID=A0A8X6RIH6_TRICX|nr:retrovirus-related Pol polyprotein from transposon 17.6 [Trichonephila clavipes]